MRIAKVKYMSSGDTKNKNVNCRIKRSMQTEFTVKVKLSKVKYTKVRMTTIRTHSKCYLSTSHCAPICSDASQKDRRLLCQERKMGNYQGRGARGGTLFSVCQMKRKDLKYVYTKKIRLVASKRAILSAWSLLQSLN